MNDLHVYIYPLFSDFPPLSVTTGHPAELPEQVLIQLVPDCQKRFTFLASQGREDGLAVGLCKRMGHWREKLRRHLVNTGRLLGLGLDHSPIHPRTEFYSSNVIYR